jgi:hypothetical protein
VLFYSCDFFRPGNQAPVRYSGSILSFGFGKRFEGVLQLLLKRRAGHRQEVITRASGARISMSLEDGPPANVVVIRLMAVPRALHGRAQLTAL